MPSYKRVCCYAPGEWSGIKKGRMGRLATRLTRLNQSASGLFLAIRKYDSVSYYRVEAAGVVADWSVD